MERLTEEQGRRYLTKQVGIRHDDNPALFVVLLDALKFPVPEPWQVVTSEESAGEVYFYQPENKETSWQIPFHTSIEDLQSNFLYVWDNEAEAEAHDREAQQRCELALEAWRSRLEERVAEYTEVAIPPEESGGVARSYYYVDDVTTWDSPRSYEKKFFDPKNEPLSRLLEPAYREYLREYEKYYRNSSSSDDDLTGSKQILVERSDSREEGGPPGGSDSRDRTLLSGSESGVTGTLVGSDDIAPHQNSITIEEGVAAAERAGSSRQRGISSGVRAPSSPGPDSSFEASNPLLQRAVQGDSSGVTMADATAAASRNQHAEASSSSSSTAKQGKLTREDVYDRTPTLDPEGLSAVIEQVTNSRSSSSSKAYPTNGSLRSEAESTIKNWDSGLALRKWMIPEQYGKYLQIDGKNETELLRLFSQLFMRPLMPPWRAQRDDRSRVFFQPVGSIPEDKKAWKHPLQTFFAELIPVVRHVLESDDVADKKSRLVAVMQKHAGRKSIKGMGTWMEVEEVGDNGEKQVLFVNREDTQQKRTDSPKLASCIQVYTKLWMLVHLWDGIFVDPPAKCPLSDDECWSLATRLGNMVIQRDSVPPSEPLTAKIDDEEDVSSASSSAGGAANCGSGKISAGGTPRTENDQPTCSASSNKKPEFVSQLPLGEAGLANANSTGVGGAGGSKTADADHNSAASKVPEQGATDSASNAGGTEPLEAASSSVRSGREGKSKDAKDHREQAAAAASLAEQVAAERERLLAEEREARLRHEEKTREDIARAREEWAKERKATQDEMNLAIQAVLDQTTQKTEEALKRQQDEDLDRKAKELEKRLAAETSARDEEFRAKLAEVEARMAEQLASSLEQIREQVKSEVSQKPEKRTDMELDWQRDFDHQCQRLQDQWQRRIEAYKGNAELELQQSIRQIREQHDREQAAAQERWREKDREFVEEQRHLLEGTASRSVSDLAVESQKMMGEHQRLVEAALEQKKMALEKQYAERTRQTDEHIAERRKEIGRDLDTRKTQLEEDLVRTTKEIELQVHSRYMEQFERETLKHQETLMAQTQELQQKAYHEVKKKHTVILDELERDAKQRQEVYLAERSLQASRLQIESDALEESRRKAELERKRLEEARAETERLASQRLAGDTMRLEGLERKFEEKLSSLERSLAETEREALRRETELRSDLENTRKSLSESVRLVEQLSMTTGGGPGMMGVSGGFSRWGPSGPQHGGWMQPRTSDHLQHSVTTQLHASPERHRGGVSIRPGQHLPLQHLQSENLYLPDPPGNAAARISVETTALEEHGDQLTPGNTKVALFSTPGKGDYNSSPASKGNSKGSTNEENLKHVIKGMQMQMEEMQRQLRTASPQKYLENSGGRGGMIDAPGSATFSEAEPRVSELKEFFREFQAQQSREMAQLRQELGGNFSGGDNMPESPGKFTNKYMDRVILDSVREVVTSAMNEAFVADDYNRQQHMRRKKDPFNSGQHHQQSRGGAGPGVVPSSGGKKRGGQQKKTSTSSPQRPLMYPEHEMSNLFSAEDSSLEDLMSGGGGPISFADPHLGSTYSFGGGPGAHPSSIQQNYNHGVQELQHQQHHNMQNSSINVVGNNHDNHPQHHRSLSSPGTRGTSSGDGLSQHFSNSGTGMVRGSTRGGNNMRNSSNGGRHSQVAHQRQITYNEYNDPASQALAERFPDTFRVLQMSGGF
ncbi:unnamed protein product [Amoebophrya sp. A25]|nr:unnamed protein product [Amoebophrya sp. A25]|eukprot:GSA25T00000526001.1